MVSLFLCINSKENYYAKIKGLANDRKFFTQINLQTYEYRAYILPTNQP